MSNKLSDAFERHKQLVGEMKKMTPNSYMVRTMDGALYNGLSNPLETTSIFVPRNAFEHLNYVGEMLRQNPHADFRLKIGDNEVTYAVKWFAIGEDAVVEATLLHGRPTNLSSFSLHMLCDASTDMRSLTRMTASMDEDFSWLTSMRPELPKEYLYRLQHGMNRQWSYGHMFEGEARLSTWDPPAFGIKNKFGVEFFPKSMREEIGFCEYCQHHALMMDLVPLWGDPEMMVHRRHTMAWGQQDGRWLYIVNE